MEKDSFVYGGFWRRFFALALDGIICFVPSLLFSFAIPYIGGVLFSLLYRPLFDASPLGASPGRAFMGLKLLNSDGTQVSLKMAYLRLGASYISAIVFCVGYFMALFTSRKQTLHDLLTDTMVVRAETPPVNFFKYWFDLVANLFETLLEKRKSSPSLPHQPNPNGPTRPE